MNEQNEEMRLRSDSGRCFEIPPEIALEYEKFDQTGFLARKEAEFHHGPNSESQADARSKMLNKQFQYWMKLLDHGWDVERGGCSITVSCNDSDPGMELETIKRLQLEEIRVEREEYWEKVGSSRARRLIYHFRRL